MYLGLSIHQIALDFAAGFAVFTALAALDFLKLLSGLYTCEASGRWDVSIRRVK